MTETMDLGEMAEREEFYYRRSCYLTVMRTLP